MTTPLLELRNLSTVYPARRGLVNAVDSINLELNNGDILGLVGESGCGKSTVLLSILRLIRKPGYISGGEIIYKGQNLRKLPQSQMRSLRGREIAMIFQDPLSTLNPVFTVGEQIREALELHNIMDNGKRRFFRGNTYKREKARVLEVMEEVGISTPQSRYRSYPHEFSGGMQQRALIAIALACSPAVLLADEPTTALDVTIQAQILNLMKRINQDHETAIILVTHDLGVAAEFCDSIAVMYAGRIVEKGSVDQVVEDPQHPYTKGLLQCRPRITAARERIAPIPGNVPDLSDLPEGCAFSPRCPDYRQVCSQGPVPMMEASSGVVSRCLKHTGYERNPSWAWSDRVELTDRIRTNRGQMTEDAGLVGFEGTG
jgi:oligopeptide/dipeptide ABC transporter ATP-binding protein